MDDNNKNNTPPQGVSLLKKLRSFNSRFASKLKYYLLPQHEISTGFLVYMLLGWALLCLPWMHKVQAPLIDNLFTAASALSTTGLMTVPLSDVYNFGGQLVILFLIQLGGIGYMTFTSFILLSSHKMLSRYKYNVIAAEFALPEGFDLRFFLKSVIIFTAIVEFIGAAALFAAFKYAGLGAMQSLWSGIFHSISAFCTAGLSLYNTSFEGFINYPLITKIISALIILGCFGFIPVTDLINNIRGKTHKISYTTKIIFGAFVAMALFGTAVFFVAEPSISHLSFDSRLLASFFQTVNAITTAGFNNVPLSGLALPVLLSLSLLMYIGAAPSGTGGGIKSTTAVAVLAIISSKIHNRKIISFLGRAIPLRRLYMAVTIFTFYAIILFSIIFMLSFTEKLPLGLLLFESVSALSTVGLSMGITPQLSFAGKCIIIAAMFIGRIGVLTFGLVLFGDKKANREKQPKKEDIAV